MALVIVLNIVFAAVVLVGVVAPLARSIRSGRAATPVAAAGRLRITPTRRRSPVRLAARPSA